MEIKNTLPGYKVNKYLIVLNPHNDLANRISEVRKEFNEKFNVENPSKSRPNVLIATFTQYELMEERIVNRLHTIAMAQTPFKIELKDFGSFPGHTIFVNVTTKVPFQSLVKEIRSETQRLMKLNDDNKPYFAMEPNFKISSKLKPWQYEAAWLEYSRKHFTGRFVADSMLLLKHKQDEKGWQIVRRLEFENLPVLTKQGELFG